ncbi:hypothetical protein ACQBAT_04445 [Ornithinimicrobium sp. Y1847]|uniref:hypothetical protein n=1 Tax=Ornithinimicrobium sp. Y1847 TaxID=3405419 RepID=UPI003B67BFEA
MTCLFLGTMVVIAIFREGLERTTDILGYPFLALIFFAPGLALTTIGSILVSNPWSKSKKLTEVGPVDHTGQQPPWDWETFVGGLATALRDTHFHVVADQDRAWLEPHPRRGMFMADWTGPFPTTAVALVRQGERVVGISEHEALVVAPEPLNDRAQLVTGGVRRWSYTVESLERDPRAEEKVSMKDSE